MDPKTVVYRTLMLVKRGWCKDQYLEPGGDDAWRYSLRAALVDACEPLSQPNNRDALAQTARIIDDHIRANTPHDGMVELNDAPETTQQDVVQILRNVYATL